MILGRQRLAVEPNFLTQAIVRQLGIGAVERNEKCEDPSALDVLKKSESESLSSMRSLDDSRDVGDEKTPMPRQTRDTQVGLERREGVVGDLGTGGGDD